VGTRTLTATYAGDANFIGSTSPGVAQSVIGPLVSFSPASLNFGNVYLGLPSVRSITLTNVGNASVSIANVQISGGNDSAAFKVLSLCPSVLAAGKSCQLIVTLLPTGSNYSPTATLVVTDSAFGSPQYVPLSATVINPKASLSTYDLNFGKQTVSTSSSSKQVTLTNIGTTPLTLSSFTTAGDFAVAPGGSCADAESLAPGAACTIAIAFNPEAKGLRLGTVNLKDNALLGEQIVLLTGVGD
jgi:trimeric autotransporter adhesin